MKKIFNMKKEHKPNIVVLGGTGILGSKMNEIDNTLLYFNHELDIRNYELLEKKLNILKPDIIINLVGIKTKEVIDDKIKAIDINIVGSSNVAKYCIKYDKRLIYISTDYVYPGVKGNYSENEDINPENLYAWTKLAGEASTKLVENHLIIRTSFGEDKFPYNEAFDNLYTSKDYADIIALKILKIISSDYTGVVNIGTERKSIYDFASRKNIINKSLLFKQKDFSLNTDLYNKLLLNLDKKNYIDNNYCPITNRNEKIKYFDLGNMPLVNNLVDTYEESIMCEKYPLSVSVFTESGLSALNEIIPSNKMFMNYLYRSSTSKPYIIHCENMFSYLTSIISLNENDICVDIGGNDGTLLMAFNRIEDTLNLNKCKKINIEPSKNLYKISEENGINTINEYFSEDTHNIIGKKAKIIVTTNVFQHLLDINDFVRGIVNLLSNDGVWCLEFPYWGNTMETNQFDQIYHEHVYYYLVTPLNILFNKYSLKIIRVMEHYIHGGSLRLIITKNESNLESDGSIDIFIEKEKKYNQIFYDNWSKKINEHLIECNNILNSISGNIVGFGAAAKGCVFLNKLNLTSDKIKYVIDDTKEKQNKYIPGTGIKIVDRSVLNDINIDYILILAHNFADYIINSLKNDGYNGKFLILLPNIKIV